MKAYCTKYALTDGITIIDGESVGEGMLRVKDTSYYYHGKDWHMTLKSAKERAEEMRDRKIISVKKSLERLEELTFEAKQGEGAVTMAEDDPYALWPLIPHASLPGYRGKS